MPTTEFYHGSDWESSSGPIISRAFDASADLWPHGLNSESDGAGDKDVLADGLHPFLAIGPKGNRPDNLVGVVITYNAAADIAEMNVAPGFCAKAYVANTLTYGGGVGATFDTSPDVGDPVYVDDSDQLDSGVTLSMSPSNDDAGGNPIAGILFYDQDDYADYGVGGPNAAADWPKTCANELTYFLATVLLYPALG